MDFSPQKYVLMNIHEYANEPICIFEYHMEGQCLCFYLIPILLVFDEVSYG